MSSAYRVLTALELEGLSDPSSEFAFDVLTGLAESPKRLSSRYFYDDRGSEIFQQIMGLEEYYLTDCAEILLSDGQRVVASCTLGMSEAMGVNTLEQLAEVEAALQTIVKFTDDRATKFVHEILKSRSRLRPVYSKEIRQRLGSLVK